jgi:hypothetical protein
MSAELHGDEPGAITLEVLESLSARNACEREVFGKRVLFSDHEDWSLAEIVAAYRWQWVVGSDFRQMKDRDVVSFSPMFHFTEQNIRVHAFYCVLALSLAPLMARRWGDAGAARAVQETRASRFRREGRRWSSVLYDLGSNFDNLAEREGFEPSDPVSQVNSLAVSPIRPLSHLSVGTTLAGSR